ncbi:DsrE family protein [Massilia sp. Root351]|jgi:intracellular sulfur oxidation DsrE/DsrF family protein|uniref:DsrE family protein n=1 Tax=Massilia sp. Root351 TaxID=1736522 RepID=UPI0009E99E8F|nr:DsrE family protein [Massilia sp. Root351]
MKLLRTFFAVLFALLALIPAAATAATPQIKVVYHVNNSDGATAVLNNIRNHLNASPAAKIVVVTHGPGIDFLLDGVKNANGNPYDIPVQELADRGVEFRVCKNTLDARKLDKSKLLPETKIVPSGVAEIARLQAEEGFVYLKP